MKALLKPLASAVALAALAGTMAGCADPYSPRYAYPQAYSSPAAYGYAPAYAYGAGPRYAQASDWNAYRNYNGIHPGPEITFSRSPGPRVYYP
ncbi:MAG: hypothetical protein U1E23_03135 [Reyranellaceae bacterium]